MRNFSVRTPAAGVLAGLAVLVLATGPAFAQRDDDEGTPMRHEVRFYGNDDEGGAYASKGGYLGVRVQEITRDLMRARDLPNTQGALINRVEEDSPADRAGIRRGDVIVRVDGNEISDPDELIREMRQQKPGSRTAIVVLRDGLRKTFNVTLARRPARMDAMPSFHYGPMGDYSDLQRRLSALEDQQRQLVDEIRALREELRARSGSRGRDDD